MKLYATVTSERASKGQGGEWLDIDIFTTNRENATHRVEVREKQGEITITLMRSHFGKWYNAKDIDTVYINAPKTKGEKQKGECAKCRNALNIEGKCCGCMYPPQDCICTE
jgi:hypothetical protein